MTTTKQERNAVRREDKARGVWFWKPSLYWFGWKTLIPFLYGHDEYARRTLLFGWTITGRIIIPVWECDEAEQCWDEAEYARPPYIDEDEE